MGILLSKSFPNCSYHNPTPPAGIGISQSVTSSKKDGKKRAVEDDGDATAMEDDATNLEKTTKKKKTQLK
jgi:hypothetical protein